MLLITGANGKLGRLIVEEVLRRAPEAARAGQPASVPTTAGAGVRARRQRVFSWRRG